MAPILRHRPAVVGGVDESDEELSQQPARTTPSQSPNSKRGFLRCTRGGCWCLIQLLAYVTTFLLPTSVLLFYWTVDGKQRLTSSLPPQVQFPTKAAAATYDNYNNNHRVVFPQVVLPVPVTDGGSVVHPVVVPRPRPTRQHRSERRKTRTGRPVPDFGGIDYRSAVGGHGRKKKRVFARVIPREEDDRLRQPEKPNKRKYYVDDSDRYSHREEIDYPKESGCYKPQWAFEVRPSCNGFHELPLSRNAGAEETLNVTYVGRGHFRSGWSVLDAAEQDGSNRDDVVLKTIRLLDDKDTITTTGIAMTQTEAVTMLATSGSNRTTNIYGHCSTSVMVEHGEPFRRNIIESWGWRDQDKLDARQVDDVRPANDFTPEEKLQMSLHMAEGLADLHGYQGGVIVNHDISLDQWVVGKDGIIKLNDFNKAHILQWNPDKQEYCKFHSQQTLLYYAPEEMKGADVDESADVHTFGKIMYILLTGLKPYYHKGSGEAAVEAIHAGEFPYVDPRYRTRSMIEGRLVEMMERMWQRNPSDRPSIFSVIEDLRETVRLAGLAT